MVSHTTAHTVSRKLHSCYTHTAAAAAARPPPSGLGPSASAIARRAYPNRSGGVAARGVVAATAPGTTPSRAAAAGCSAVCGVPLLPPPSSPPSSPPW
eukprot:scaffold77845_cov51-Phaeocystis_antarctica.AAC.2